MPRNASERQAGLRASTSGRTSGHWTLDESNPDRIGFAAYGRAVGLGETVIRKYARAYEGIRSAPPDSSTGGRNSWSEQLDRKALGAEAEAATEALAEKWRAFEAASKDDAQTRRMRSLVLASTVPWVIGFVLIAAFTVVMAFR